MRWFKFETHMEISDYFFVSMSTPDFTTTNPEVYPSWFPKWKFDKFDLFTRCPYYFSIIWFFHFTVMWGFPQEVKNDALAVQTEEDKIPNREMAEKLDRLSQEFDEKYRNHKKREAKD